MRPPVIAVCGPDRGGLASWLFASAAIRRAGGHPIRITPSTPGLGVEPEGLLLGGGADVSERLDLQTLRDSARTRVVRNGVPRRLNYVLGGAVYLVRSVLGRRSLGIDGARDALEARLLGEALSARIPVLGICRGAQLINVVLGGTLHRELSSFYVESPNPWTVFPKKWVTIAAGSGLAAAVGAHRCAVNSLHRNAIATLGRGVRVVAREDNGIVQGIEVEDHAFVIGVQWHPEYLPQCPEQGRLFERFVGTAAGAREIGVDHRVAAHGVLDEAH